MEVRLGFKPRRRAFDSFGTCPKQSVPQGTLDKGGEICQDLMKRILGRFLPLLKNMSIKEILLELLSEF